MFARDSAIERRSPSARRMGGAARRGPAGPFRARPPPPGGPMAAAGARAARERGARGAPLGAPALVEAGGDLELPAARRRQLPLEPLCGREEVAFELARRGRA